MPDSRFDFDAAAAAVRDGAKKAVDAAKEKIILSQSGFVPPKYDRTLPEDVQSDVDEQLRRIREAQTTGADAIHRFFHSDQ